MTQPGNRGLGKGFDSLIPQNFDASILLDEDERIQKLKPSQLSPNPEQPRQYFDQNALDELADSVKRYGILQPLVVTPATKAGEYFIIAGERRWRAAKLAKLATVPAVVRTTEQLERLELALVENVQRVDLSPLEQAASILRLHEQFNMSYGDISRRLGKAQTTLSNMVRLLQLPADAKQALMDQKITEGHARAILALKDADRQQELLELILTNDWTVRQAERYVTANKAGLTDTKQVRERVATTTPATVKLAKTLGTKVQLRRTAKGGKLEITFKDDDDLGRILKRISEA